MKIERAIEGKGKEKHGGDGIVVVTKCGRKERERSGVEGGTWTLPGLIVSLERLKAPELFEPKLIEGERIKILSGLKKNRTLHLRDEVNAENVEKVGEKVVKSKRHRIWEEKRTWTLSPQEIREQKEIRLRKMRSRGALWTLSSPRSDSTQSTHWPMDEPASPSVYRKNQCQDGKNA